MMLQQDTAWTNPLKPSRVYPNARVLLADDMRINQEVFRKAVQPWKLDVDVVRNGAQAVEAVKKQSYQLIFLDQIMPRMTGAEAAEIIRLHCDTPLIALTADVSDEMRKGFLQRGFTDFLTKPLNVTLLAQIIEKYIPAEYARKPDLETEAAGPGRRILETYIKEIRPLAARLQDYAGNDREMFRITVHGIKGASRQIGKISVSETAAALETAAVKGDFPFIHSHLDSFLRELEESLEDIERELAQPSGQQEKCSMLPNSGKAGSFSKEELLMRLKKGFDAYNIREIEESLDILSGMSLSKDSAEEGLSAETSVMEGLPAETSAAENWLSDTEKSLLERAKEAAEELEYEKGSELLSEYFQNNARP